jgi:hypothetical protein
VGERTVTDAGLNISVTLKGDLRGRAEEIREKFARALTTAANIAASMVEQKSKVDVENAGFTSLASSLHAQANGDALGNMTVALSGDERVALLEEGGTIHGHPLLWIPIGGERYHGSLFSARYPRKSGPPLLFSVADKLPKFFGLESVTMPRKLHLRETMHSVMSNFRAIFQEAYKNER